MKFELSHSIEILRQTPDVLARLQDDLSPAWTASSNDRENWGPYDVVGHLIQGEETDWITRAEIILAHAGNRKFQPFDRLAQFDSSRGKELSDLLTEFAHLRKTNIERLVNWQLTEKELRLTGVHPAFGEVTLEQLLATWVVHDLNHIRQIVTYMSEKYADAVGPWKQYLSIIKN